MPNAAKSMERIAILGCSGAGKSTLARAVGEKLKLPVIHLDNLFWLPGWKEMPQDQFMQLQRERLSESRWVVDGNYSGSLHIRFELADTIVFLDFPRYRCLYQAIIKRRWIYRNTTRPCAPPGCPEKIDWEFIWWIWNFRRRSRSQILASLAACPPSKNVVHLRNPREVNDWLAGLA